MTDNKILVGFHIGRGGKYRTAGYVTFMPQIHFIQQCMNGDDMIVSQDENGNTLPDEEWYMCDGVGNIYPDMRGREACEADTGRIERDGIYDTDVVMDIEDCPDTYLEAIWKCYTDDTSCIKDDVIDYIVNWKGMHRISSVKCYPTNIAIFYTDEHMDSIHMDGYKEWYEGEDDIRDTLQNLNVDPVSIKNNTGKIAAYYNML